jgi:hypothetical protein
VPTQDFPNRFGQGVKFDAAVKVLRIFSEHDEIDVIAVV